MKPWQKFVMLVLASAVIHEAGHAIVGGGIKGFEYAPDRDLLSTRIYVNNWSIYSTLAGFVFTLPLLALGIFPRLMFLIFIFQSRWDFLSILQRLNPYSFDFGWTVIAG